MPIRFTFLAPFRPPGSPGPPGAVYCKSSIGQFFPKGNENTRLRPVKEGLCGVFTKSGGGLCRRFPQGRGTAEKGRVIFLACLPKIWYNQCSDGARRRGKGESTCS
ncbi:hypothetical protein HMPREF0262_02586 [Clostridium sp. ATCC 29733]|nr:hypothetical protein HMPREF0262_02586 [Clostridium sp. ATCC 29733]